MLFSPGLCVWVRARSILPYTPIRCICLSHSHSYQHRIDSTERNTCEWLKWNRSDIHKNENKNRFEIEYEYTLASHRHITVLALSTTLNTEQSWRVTVCLGQAAENTYNRSHSTHKTHSGYIFVVFLCGVLLYSPYHSVNDNSSSRLCISHRLVWAHLNCMPIKKTKILRIDRNGKTEFDRM